jgi:2-polyprenyl-3-methyl-5-hydroxy-6-metoxy-1,4-benzoquinol methylase
MQESEMGSIPHAREGRVIAAKAARPAVHQPRPIRMTIGGDMRAARRAFADQALGTRLFLRGRDILCPMAAVAREVPMSGRILDIGCGHGLFPALLASGSSQRTIVGVDPSEGKINVARGSTRTFPNISYIQGSVLDLNDGPYDAITILDVLYLLPDDLKRKILAHARKLIRDDGVFLLKTNDTHPRWKFAVVRLEEWLMVKLLRYTYGGELHFRSSEQYLQMLDEAGFTTEVRQIEGWRPVPHRLFVCRPK